MSAPKRFRNPGPEGGLGAIVLAGGRSSRMGRSKACLDFHGRPLLLHVVTRLRPWVTDFVVVAAPGQELPPLDGADAPERLTVLRDELPGEGPLPALALGLAAIATPWALAVGCDAPLLRATVVEHLLAARTDADAVIPVWDGRPQPLAALYRAALAPGLASLVAAGERRMHAIASLPGVRLVGEEELRAVDPEGESFRSVNTPEEYAVAVAVWGGRGAKKEKDGS